MRSLRVLGGALLLSLTGPASSGTASAEPKAADPNVPRAVAAELPDAGEPRSLRDLLGRFQQSPGVSADFEEEKRITLLREPLLSRGTVAYARGVGLVHQVSWPRKATALLRAGRLSVSDDGGSRTIDLSSHPSASALVHTLVNLLGGDHNALSRDFASTFTLSSAPEPGGWSLQLLPRGEALRGLLERIAFRGTGITLSEMRIRESSGDETTVRFSRVNPARTFTKEEQRRLFGPAQ